MISVKNKSNEIFNFGSKKLLPGLSIQMNDSETNRFKSTLLALDMSGKIKVKEEISTSKRR